jgi:multifunctional 2-oxoglutarate metabolism enzyme
VRWVQDEPGNMGAGPWYSLNVWPELDVPVEIITRPRSSSPSVGTAKRHVEEQKGLVAEAFDTESDRTVQNY